MRSNQRISKYSLRKVILEKVPEWVKKSPYSFRVQAVYEAHQAFSESRKKGTSKKQAGRFRSCRDRVQSLQFREEDYKGGSWFKNYTKGLSFIASEPLPIKEVEFEQKLHDGSYKKRVRKQSWDSATQLVYDKKRWFAVFPVSFVPETSESVKFIALDPGVRSFLTGFDGEKFVEVGNRDITRIYRLGQHTDKLISQKSQLKGTANKRTRQRLSQKINRLLVRIRNLIDEVHKKTAKYLTSEYKLIFLPTFETSQMVAKDTRKIRSKTVRQMLRWSHYRFKMFLKFQAFKRGATVIDVTEEYTSKTCTRCGHIHEKLGGHKVFKCPLCGHILPRDFNGALGIFLKALRDTASVMDASVTVLCPDSSLHCPGLMYLSS
jgi:putative transposase